MFPAIEPNRKQKQLEYKRQLDVQLAERDETSIVDGRAANKKSGQPSIQKTSESQQQAFLSPAHIGEWSKISNELQEMKAVIGHLAPRLSKLESNSMGSAQWEYVRDLVENLNNTIANDESTRLQNEMNLKSALKMDRERNQKMIEDMKRLIAEKLVEKAEAPPAVPMEVQIAEIVNQSLIEKQKHSEEMTKRELNSLNSKIAEMREKINATHKLFGTAAEQHYSDNTAMEALSRAMTKLSMEREADVAKHGDLHKNLGNFEADVMGQLETISKSTEELKVVLSAEITGRRKGQERLHSVIEGVLSSPDRFQEDFQSLRREFHFLTEQTNARIASIENMMTSWVTHFNRQLQDLQGTVQDQLTVFREEIQQQKGNNPQQNTSDFDNNSRLRAVEAVFLEKLRRIQNEIVEEKSLREQRERKTIDDMQKLKEAVLQKLQEESSTIKADLNAQIIEQNGVISEIVSYLQTNEPIEGEQAAEILPEVDPNDDDEEENPAPLTTASQRLGSDNNGDKAYLSPSLRDNTFSISTMSSPLDVGAMSRLHSERTDTFSRAPSEYNNGDGNDAALAVAKELVEAVVEEVVSRRVSPRGSPRNVSALFVSKTIQAAVESLSPRTLPSNIQSTGSSPRPQTSSDGLMDQEAVRKHVFEQYGHDDTPRREHNDNSSVGLRHAAENFVLQCIETAASSSSKTNSPRSNGENKMILDEVVDKEGGEEVANFNPFVQSDIALSVVRQLSRKMASHGVDDAMAAVEFSSTASREAVQLISKQVVESIVQAAISSTLL